MTNSDQKNIETVQAIYAAFGRGDVQAILDRLDEDVTWGIESQAANEVAPYGVGRGKEHVAKFAAAWATSVDFRTFDGSDYVVAGEHVYNHLSYDAIVKATGKTLKNVSMQHWTLKNGKVIRWRGYEDTAATRDAFRK